MKHLDHIGIATVNLAQSLEFFEGKLGLRCSQIQELPERGIRVAFLPIGDTHLELIEALHDHSEISSFLAQRGPGLHHVAVKLRQLPDNLETIKPLQPGAQGSSVAFVHPKKTGGVLLELCVHES